jgi:hypothetical protein
MFTFGADSFAGVLAGVLVPGWVVLVVVLVVLLGRCVRAGLLWAGLAG